MIRFTIFYIALQLLTIGCGEHDEKESKASNLELLDAKRKIYLELSSATLDEDGWILTKECDSLLHTSLYYFGGGSSDILKAQDEDGRFWRRPGRDCLAKGGSKSSLSRDMMLGAMIAIWKAKDLSTIEKAISYVEKTGSMGEHDGSLDGRNRVSASPAFEALMYELRDQLGGKYSSKQEIPQAYFPQKGYQAHLQALNIALMGMMSGKISTIQRNTLASQVEDDPNNAVYQALFHKYEDGDQTKAVEILLREDLFPADRLPTSKDRCNAYLFMHGEKESDWGACDKGETHPGHDLLFAAALILDYPTEMELAWRLIGQQ